ncbi:MAG: urate hydroxylase PuuD, partial [Pseudomonadota bacterium]
GVIAKQRSTHNNYLTLPVLFLMLSNHYPLAFASDWNWLIASLVFLMGVTIRHFFNTMHAKGGKLWWTWAATAALFAAIVWLSSAPMFREEVQAMGPGAVRLAEASEFEDVVAVVQGRCSMCHQEAPAWDGLHWAPKGVHLETDEDIAHHGREIFLQAGVSHAMPPGNITWMEPEERALIVQWYRSLH